MLLQYEAVREDVEIWFDVVVEQSAQGQRPLYAVRFGKRVVGYMILKPWDHKISSIFIEPGHRGKGCAETLYGMGAVSLGTPQPYTAFVPEMTPEFRHLIQTQCLVLDDTGPLHVLNPGDGQAETWTEAPPPPEETEIEQQKRQERSRKLPPSQRAARAASAYGSFS